MASRLLYELVAPALEVTGPPEWRYDDARADLDRLEWLRPEDAPDGDWMLLCPDTGDHLDDMDDIVLEEPVARDLLIAHFQRWLAERGW